MWRHTRDGGLLSDQRGGWCRRKHGGAGHAGALHGRLHGGADEHERWSACACGGGGDGGACGGRGSLGASAAEGGIALAAVVVGHGGLFLLATRRAGGRGALARLPFLSKIAQGDSLLESQRIHGESRALPWESGGGWSLAPPFGENGS